MDTQENPAITILNERFYESQKHLTLSKHSYSAWALLMSKKVWDELTDVEHRMLREVAQQTREFQRTLIRKESRDAISALKSKGMEVVELSSIELSRVRMLVRERTEKYKSQVDLQWRNSLYLNRLGNVLDNISTMLPTNIAQIKQKSPQAVKRHPP